jgi:hypothetical protein
VTGQDWVEELRNSYRPDELEVLLVGESPPDSSGGETRFFYSPVLSRYDNLYRGVTQALYEEEPAVELHNKVATLKRLRSDGYWLIDATEAPINRSSTSARRRTLRTAVPSLVERCLEAGPRHGVIVCHSLVYEIAAPALLAAGLNLLHDAPLPFPLGNWRAQFIKGFRGATQRT